MELEIRTLTPLWTGGIEADKLDRIHETGILGSLRWWYEAIVRGLGGQACDPTTGGCKYKREKGESHEQAYERLCDACRLFGATGWRRRFRLEVEDNTEPLWPGSRPLNIRPPDRSRGWFLPPGCMGTLTLRLDGDAETLSLLTALFLFLERWGNLGAKPQLGYGVFEIVNWDGATEWADGNGKQKSAWEWKTLGTAKPDANLPDLRRFSFFRYRFESSPGWWTRVSGIARVVSKVQPLVSMYKTVPVAPALKNEWRFHRWSGSRPDEREVFGALRPKRHRSKVAVSWAYPAGQGWEIRGWAWLSAERWADKVWRLLQDPDGWQAALKVSGDLETYRVETNEQAAEFLEATK